jgi:hypothetical protein
MPREGVCINSGRWIEDARLRLDWPLAEWVRNPSRRILHLRLRFYVIAIESGALVTYLTPSNQVCPSVTLLLIAIVGHPIDSLHTVINPPMLSLFYFLSRGNRSSGAQPSRRSRAGDSPILDPVPQTNPRGGARGTKNCEHDGGLVIPVLCREALVHGVRRTVALSQLRWAISGCTVDDPAHQRHRQLPDGLHKSPTH